MPIIIWGSRGLTSRLDQGQFYCPRCDREKDYHLKQVRPFFTLYFIPLFPVGGAERYVECLTCGGTFKEEVLDMEPPTEGQRLLSHLFEDLNEGVSLEAAEEQLVLLGMDRAKAQNVLEEITGGDTWRCGGCSQRYLNSVKRCRKCRE